MQILAVVLICVGVIWFLNKTIFSHRSIKRRAMNRRESHYDSGLYYVSGSNSGEGYYASSSSTDFGGGSFGGGGAGGDWGGSDGSGDSGGGGDGGGD